MYKRIKRIATLAATTLLLVSTSQAYAAGGDLEVLLGGKQLDSKGWNDGTFDNLTTNESGFASQMAIGLNAVVQPDNLPIAGLISITYAGAAGSVSDPANSNNNINSLGSTLEAMFGTRVYLVDWKFRLFVEGMGGFARAAMDTSTTNNDGDPVTISAEGQALTWGAGAGLDINVTKSFSLGFLARYSKGSTMLKFEELFDVGEVNTGGMQYLGYVAFHYDK